VKLWKFVTLVVGLALLFGVGLLLGNALLVPRLVHHNAEVRVPDLLDRPIDLAVAAAADCGLRVEVLREESHPVAPVGTVVTQHPPAGDTVRQGRPVLVVVSAGPPAGGVPLLAGLGVKQAGSTLQRESYRLGRTVRVRDGGGVADVVVMQSPPAGTRLRKGEPVGFALSVPAPMPSFLMPDLRGFVMPLAREAVEAAGCVAAAPRYERDSSLPYNTVIAQSPPPGARIYRGESVELVASTR
jgi:serine/threonine-protein kinase